MELLSHLFRLEYTKITAVLCRNFGLKHIEIAEDIVSDTFLKASQHWAVNGIPENPRAWLYVVAKNKTKDYFRKLSVFETKIKKEIQPCIEVEPNFEFDSQMVSDSQLAMIFAVCNPVNSDESQICLALQIFCGFSIEEIADSLLTKSETIKKRLQRARANLRNDNFQLKSLTKTEICLRLNIVLRTLYLLFSEGYFSKSDKQQIKIDLCSEATRLTLLLTENSLTNTAECNALLALMCFQSSRLRARTNDKNEAILFDEQDKSLWDKSLIERGNYYLINATTGNELSKYHLEAGIAYWHTTTTGKNKWDYILKLYNQLILIDYSPITALNRTFAFAKVYGNKEAIPEAKKLNLVESNYYHELLGYLYSSVNIKRAIEHYKQAINLAKSNTERQTLSKKIMVLSRILKKSAISH